MHFLDGTELSSAQLTSLLDRALALKGAPAASRALDGRSVALLFEKPSTRTRRPSSRAAICTADGKQE